MHHVPQSVKVREGKREGQKPIRTNMGSVKIREETVKTSVKHLFLFSEIGCSFCSKFLGNYKTSQSVKIREGSVKGNVKQFVRHSYAMKMSKDLDTK